MLTAMLEPMVLADLPTPIARLDRLGAEWGHPDLYIKRDDLTSRLYGGNKVRKLELLLGEARREGATTLVTMGGTGSNHLLATALHGGTLGMRTVGVVFPQPETENVRRNQAADRGAGVKLVQAPSKYLLPFYLAATMASIKPKEGRRPWLIPGGGSSPLGALGFVNAALELAAQLTALGMPEPRAIYLPYGTGGTAAGLAVGLLLSGLRTRVMAVRVIDRLLANRPRLMRLARAVARLLASAGDRVELPSRPGANLELVGGYLGPGYGHPTASAERAVDLFRTLEGVTIEGTYTGKAASAFLDAARNDRGPLIFWNTYSSADIGRWVELGREPQAG